MEMGPKHVVLSDRLLKPGVEPATPGLQGEWFIHYTTAAPVLMDLRPYYIEHKYDRSLAPVLGFFCFWFKVPVNCHGHVETVS